MKKIIITLLAGMTWSFSAAASTFIGNGGNMLDPSLRLTMSRIASALNHAKEYPDDVCVCRGTSEQCALVSDLNEAQTKFCSKFVADHADELLDLLKPKSGISFVWSNESMVDHKEHRSSDAIAQRNKKRIILSEIKFRDLNDAGRIQLIAHELGHFLSHEGSEIGDKGSLGPYKGADGSRQFLDTFGASIAIEATRAEVLQIEDEIYSSPFYKWRISYFAESVSYDPAFAKEAFLPGFGDRESIALAYYPRPTSNLGFAYRYSSINQNENNARGNGVNSDFHLVTNYLGLEWRGILLPGSRGPWASYLHYAVFLGGGVGSVNHRIYDSFNSESQAKNVVGGKTDVNVYLPVKFGFLVTIGIGLDYLPYTLDQLGIKNKTTSLSTSYGVSYGF
jgi:hypothetical protein